MKMTKYILIVFLLVSSALLASPFAGFEADVVDSARIRLKTIFTAEPYSNFYSVNEMRWIGEDDTTEAELNIMRIRQRLALRFSNELAFVVEIPFKDVEYKDTSGTYTVSGVGDIDAYFKYRSALSEVPLVLMIGAKIPFGELNDDVDISSEGIEIQDPTPALGDGYTDIYIGILNKSKWRGFDITSNIILVLRGISKKNEDIEKDNNFIFVGTADAPVIINGERRASITGEIDAFVSQNISDKYSVHGTAGLEIMLNDFIEIQGGASFKLLSSDDYETRGFTPTAAIQFQF
jgi:hypothetical protein